MPDPSFNVVSEVDLQEVKNAVHQATKEIATRFDFKGTGTEIVLIAPDLLEIRSETEQRLRAAVEVLEEKLVRRKVSLKALERGRIEEAARSTYKQQIRIVHGISKEKAKEIIKAVKDMRLKVQASAHGNVVRVTGKKKDDLQRVIQHLKTADFGVPLQFTNYR
ncbi:MAG: YajQ family cyclic di-GMP-binding protein [Acidimicrobiia bacterium]